MIRLLVADDHRLFRQGMLHLLADQPNLKVVAEAANGIEVMAAIREQAIDVAVLDLTMPGRSTFDLIRQIRDISPSTRILVVTMHGEEPHISQAFRAGADGYMTKEEAADDLVRAITRIARGDRYVCASVAERLALGFASGHDGKDAHSRLSEREYKIFEMLVSGKRGWEIAQALSLSEKTVSTHKAHVLKKMNVSNRTELLLYAVKHNLVSV